MYYNYDGQIFLESGGYYFKWSVDGTYTTNADAVYCELYYSHLGGDWQYNGGFYAIP